MPEGAAYAPEFSKTDDREEDLADEVVDSPDPEDAPDSRDETRPSRDAREIASHLLSGARDRLRFAGDRLRAAGRWLGERRLPVIGPIRSLAAFSSLTRRIVAFNLVGLGLLVGGVLVLNQFRSGLIDLRIQSMQTQGEIIAIAIAEAAGAGPSATRYDPVRANLVLRRLSQPTGVRAQIYDRAGRLTGDTRVLLPGSSPIETQELLPPDVKPERTWLERIEAEYNRLLRRIGGEELPLYSETPVAGVAQDEEVFAALRGDGADAVRVNSEGELIVSVSVPIQRFKAVMGVLVLSTEGGDIDAVVRAERIAILQVFLVALAVSVALSFLLASTIARPIRRLADAAERGGAQERRPINPKRIRIPDMTRRADEIGYLSGALRRMTDALYHRIDANESFAADVSHEIKNPLTSLRSAVETMRVAKTEEARERLMAVIENDVGRLDRLVTDISNASRLDAELVREETGAFDIGALIEALAEMSSDRAASRGAKIIARRPAAPVMVTGLEGRIGQVIQNLIDNGLSFSPEGGTLTVQAMRLKEGGARVLVEDEGPGVPPDNLESIFQRFYSERPETESFGDHSGLGLSIAKQIIEAHGGRIWAENRSTPDDADGAILGARFIVELPA